MPPRIPFRCPEGMLTGVVVFGLLPALRASRPDPWSTLKGTMGSIAGSGGSLFLRQGLVTLQVALSFLLLFGAGLFVKSLQNLKTTETGVAVENLVSFRLSPALSGYDDERAQVFYTTLLDRLRPLPGVTSAALASADLLPALRQEVRQLDAGMPVYAMKTVEAQLHETLLTDRLIARLSAGFGAVATRCWPRLACTA